ncbi:MAG: RES family NAD+ phosphorylase [bacterium]|jgi:RES domain-containing protein
MVVYDIRKLEYSKKLIGSGFSNRWNKDEEYVIYTSSSRALAMLELLVHRSGIDLGQGFRLLEIKLNITDKDIEEVKIDKLGKNWQGIEAYSHEQKIGSDWYKKSDKLILKVPSVVIPQEYNYVINTRHKDFEKKVKLELVEEIDFDKRII